MALPSFLLIFALIILSMVMKKTIFLFIAAILLLSCCTRGRYSARLVAADSLMNAHPDSAYAILKAISTDTLPSKADRAYYALLFTQAMYKNYDTIRSDSLINIAVNFFSDNHDREKYTRSLIYKGAALNDMGDFLGAMYSYKAAEANADSTDYENKGQVNLRMAELYEDMEIDKNISIEKYKKSLLNFEKSGNKKYQQKCLNTIGCKYRTYPIDSAYKYLFHALKLSKELGDSCAIYMNISSLARAYWADSMYEKCKDYAVFAIKNGKQYMTDQDCYYDAANSYAKLGKIDSAEYYFNQIKVGSTIEDKVSREYTLTQILRAKGDYKSALEHYLKSESMLNSFTHNPIRNQLLFSERQYDNQKNELQKLELQKERLFLCICLLLVFLILLSLVILLLRKNQRHKEDSEMIDLLQNNAIESNSSLLLKLEKESKLKVSIEKLIDNIKFLSDASYQFEDRPTTFMNVFRNRVKLSKFQDSMLNDLRFFLDEKYNNIITNLSNQYPILSDDELNFISLICFGFSFAAITVCMGYTNINYVNNKKIRIAKKMGLKEPLRQYLNNLMSKANIV
jgi:hypothetical protein